MTTLIYLQQAKAKDKLKAVSPNEDGVCPSDGLYLAPCYNSDGVLSYTCSPSGYKNVKAACDSCNPMGLKCPSDVKIKNLSRSCAGIGGNECTNSGTVYPDTKCEGCTDPNNPDSNNPDTNNPDSNNPDTNNPDTNNPDTNNPDTNNPDTNNPDTNNPDTDNPDICDTIILTKNWTDEEKTKVKSELMISPDGVSSEVADCILSFISSRFNYDYYLNITCKQHKDLVVENIKSCIEKFKPSDLKISPFIIIGIIFLIICIAGSLFYFYFTRVKSKSSTVVSNTVPTVVSNVSTGASNVSTGASNVSTNSSMPYILPSYTLPSSTLSSKCSETCTGTFTGTFKGKCV